MTKIREGYKETEIGVIPEDWEVKSFGEVSKVSQGLQIAISERFKNEADNRLPYITIQYINNPYDINNQYFVENPKLNVVCNYNDVLMTRTGNTGVVVTNQHGVFHNNFFKIDFNRDIIDRDFLVYYLNFIRKIVISRAGITTIPDLKHSNFYSIPMILPKKAEQQRIAEILSTTDAYIENLDKIIEDYQLLKKGMMKKLLTEGIGHTEFKETEIGRIPKEWEVVKLSEVGKFSAGGADKKIKEDETEINLINYMDVYKNHKIDNNIDFMKVTATQKEIAEKSVSIGDVLFTPSSETPDDIGHSAVVTENIPLGVYSYHLIKLKFERNINLYYKGYMFAAPYVLKQFSTLSQGSTRFTLSPSQFGKVKIAIPTNHKEQEAIANVLMNIDSVISNYINDLLNFKELKLSLMDKLLTGKIRVNSSQQEA